MWKMQGDAVNDKRLEKRVYCITDSPGFQASCLHVDVFGNIILSYYEFQDVHGPPEKKSADTQIKSKKFQLITKNKNTL